MSASGTPTRAMSPVNGRPSSPQQSNDTTENSMRLAGFGLPSSSSSATTPGSTTTPSISVSSAISKYNRRSERRLSLTANPKLNTIHEPNGSSSLAPASGQSNEDQGNTLSSKSRSISLMDAGNKWKEDKISKMSLAKSQDQLESIGSLSARNHTLSTANKTGGSRPSLTTEFIGDQIVTTISASQNQLNRDNVTRIS